MIKSISFLLLSFAFNAGAAMTDLPSNEKIWSTRDQKWISLTEWREAHIQPGDVVILGEQHAVGSSPSEVVHHANQHRLMFELVQQHRVSLGMEFFEYPKQELVDQFVYGNIPEPEFLKQIGWGGNAFPLYRDQVMIAGWSGGRTNAINIPRAISGKVGRSGPDSLDASEKALLPPIWERGSDAYFARFSEVMKGHVNDQQLENFFWAQSLWDDTMAWRIKESHPVGTDQVYVVIVGEFHADYGHGLPSRLGRHGVAQVKTMVQAEVPDWNPETLKSAVAADPNYGPRADYIWVYQLP